MRLIDAELLKEKFSASINTGYDTFDRDVICECIDFTPTAEQNPWIPCSERYPKYTGEYNVTVGMSGIDGYYEETTTLQYLHTAGESSWMIPKSIDLNPFILTVIAWMPLPEKYEPESVKK